ncbi:hypothetical protein KSP40_PGU012406 [Platanthera guangdongensis]|uniref:Serine aminopeptidase S33 domain-containing protein n=1 Tax=Platanthera guangdongensis TaxID=2320717 RepID=A0ABR2M9Q7_9ASPA
MRFLLGESMRGVVVLLLHRKKPSFWHGAVLVAPMCKVHSRISSLCISSYDELKRLCSVRLKSVECFESSQRLRRVKC